MLLDIVNNMERFFLGKGRLNILFNFVNMFMFFLTIEGAVCEDTTGTRCHSSTESVNNQNPKPCPRKQWLPQYSTTQTRTDEEFSHAFYAQINHDVASDRAVTSHILLMTPKRTKKQTDNKYLNKLYSPFLHELFAY